MIDTIEPSWLSVIPPCLALVIAFTTRRVLLALSLSIISAGFVLAYQTHQWSDLNIFHYFVFPAIFSVTYFNILLIYLFCLGTMIGLWHKTGGALYFARYLSQRAIHSTRSAMLFGWIVGLIFHQGGTISTVLTGTTLKPVTDQFNVSHEELAYLVDSTASPIAAVIPFNAWPIYVGGIIAGTLPFLPDAHSGYEFFFRAIPFNFYCLLTIVVTFLFCLGKMPWVGRSMQAAIVRSRTTGKLDRDGSSPLSVPDTHDFKAPHYQPSLFDFLLPIVTLLSVCIVPFILWKLDIIPPKTANQISHAFIACALVSFIFPILKGLSFKDALSGAAHGCRGMVFGAVILGLAVTIGKVTQELGTAVYLIHLLKDAMPAVALPAVLTLLCMLISFATGTSFGTYAVMFPIALPLAFHIYPDITFCYICFGAVAGGAVFGDHCSPISDTTIMSCMFSGCDLMDHVRTQFPLALLCVGLSILLSTAAAWLCIV
ncbi:MAG: Na+/H+ antiporter NhaC family protein [Pseudomonadota bacterium]